MGKTWSEMDRARKRDRKALERDRQARRSGRRSAYFQAREHPVIRVLRRWW